MGILSDENRLRLMMGNSTQATNAANIYPKGARRPIRYIKQSISSAEKIIRMITHRRRNASISLPAGGSLSMRSHYWA